MKKYIAEFIGTFGLTLAVIGSIVVEGTLETVLIAGITLALFVATIGKISGAHINPAVTLGALSLKKIKVNDAVLYIFAQFAGAALAILLTRFADTGVAVESEFTLPALLAEIIGTAIFTFGIASVVLSSDSEHDKSNRAPFVIGGSLILGASLALSLGSGGVLNPAVAFGVGSMSVVYFIGPILGSLAGMWIYKLLSAESPVPPVSSDN